MYVPDLVYDVNEAYVTWTEMREIPAWVSSVVQVETRDDQLRKLGSGIVLDTYYARSQKQWHTYVLTAAHVLLQPEGASSPEGAPSVDNRERGSASCDYGETDGNRIPMPQIRVLGDEAELLKWNRHSDLALLKIVTPDYPQLWLHGRLVDVQPVTLSTRPPKPAEEVWAIGFPVPGETLMITRGYVGGENRFDGLSHSAGIVAGNSGGGVFRDGKLIGINRAVACDSNGVAGAILALAASIKDIINFLKRQYNYVDYSYLVKTDGVMAWIADL
jgi:hypothetical protein